MKIQDIMETEELSKIQDIMEIEGALGKSEVDANQEFMEFRGL